MSSQGSAITVFFFANAAFAGAYAQDVPATSAELIEQQRAEVESVLDRSEECAPDEMQPDVIVVCRDLTEAEDQTQAAMSPLPAPVQSDRNLIGGLREQPCWIKKTPGVLCARVGARPRQVILIDLDTIPEALTEEEAALVFRMEDLPPETVPVTGERADALAD